jgi:hypothetical protein
VRRQAGSYCCSCCRRVCRRGEHLSFMPSAVLRDCCVAWSCGVKSMQHSSRNMQRHPTPACKAAYACSVRCFGCVAHGSCGNVVRCGAVVRQSACQSSSTLAGPFACTRAGDSRSASAAGGGLAFQLYVNAALGLAPTSGCLRVCMFCQMQAAVTAHDLAVQWFRTGMAKSGSRRNVVCTG